MLAIIPARGGSKGLPGKNIKLLDGKPLIAHTIHAAKEANSVTRIIVTTDDERIAEIAQEYGAEIPFIRPAHLATDTAKAIDTYNHTLNYLKEEEQKILDEFIVLQPTSPFRTSDDINDAVALFREKNADSVISYCEQHHPISWHKYIEPDGKIKSIFDTSIQNRQDEKVSFYPNGAVYVFSRKIIEANQYYSGKSYAYIMPRTRSIDIDTYDDFLWCEFLIQRNGIDKVVR